MRYEFTFADPVSDPVLEHLPELARSTVEARSTTLFGEVADSAQLHGLLVRFRQLGLTMTDMHRLPD